jgi:hypothetical protein
MLSAIKTIDISGIDSKIKDLGVSATELQHMEELATMMKNVVANTDDPPKLRAAVIELHLKLVLLQGLYVRLRSIHRTNAHIEKEYIDAALKQLLDELAITTEKTQQICEAAVRDSKIGLAKLKAKFEENERRKAIYLRQKEELSNPKLAPPTDQPGVSPNLAETADPALPAAGEDRSGAEPPSAPAPPGLR